MRRLNREFVELSVSLDSSVRSSVMVRRMKRVGLRMSVLSAGLALVVALAVDARAVTWDANTDSTWTDADSNSFVGTYNDGGPADFLGAGTGTVTVTGGGVNPSLTTVNATATNDYSFAGGSISGPLVKAGSNILSLTASNGFTTIGLGGGEVKFTHSNQLGTTTDTITVTDDTNLTFNAPGNTGTTVAKPVTIDATKTFTLSREGGQHFPTYSGKISGDGVFRIESTLANQWRISNSSNDFTTDIQAAGNVRFNNDGAMGLATNDVLHTAGTFYLNGTYNSSRELVQTSGALGGSGTWNGVISGNGFVFAGGTLTLGNTGNTFSGTIQIQTGTLEFSDPGNINGNMLQFVNSNRRARITGTPGGNFPSAISISATSHQIEVSNALASVNWTGAVSGGTSAIFEKEGPGGLNLQTAGSFTGAFNVNEGRLSINHTTANLQDIAVASGATLGGTGIVNLASGEIVSVDGSIAPGESAGQLEIGGDVAALGLDMNATSTYQWELAALLDDVGGTPGTDFDQLVVSAGDVVLDAGATLELSFGSGVSPDDIDPFWSDEHTWTVLSFTSGGTSSDNFTVLVNGEFDAGTFSVSNVGGDILLTFAPTVPEPSTGLMLGLGFVMARVVRRRRR